ncbi:MAG: dienelactone hydrolase family protein, partial [Porticoccaceae bacterium]
LDYGETDRGRALADACDQQHLLLDLQAAIDALATDNTALVGYCWGGGIAYFAACHLPVNAGVAFYGTRLPRYLHQQPNCPFQFHFGEQDNAISAEVIAQVRAVNADSDIYIYQQAGHAFANHARPSFHAASAALAEQRLVNFLGLTKN